MFVKISCILAVIVQLSSATLLWPDLNIFKPIGPKPPKVLKPISFPHQFKLVTVAPRLQEPYIPENSPCAAYQALYKSENGAVARLIRVPWDYSSVHKLQLKLVYDKFLPSEEASFQIKMVQPTEKIISEGFLYDLEYINQQVIPQLTEISINGRVICQGEPEKPTNKAGSVDDPEIERNLAKTKPNCPVIDKNRNCIQDY